MSRTCWPYEIAHIAAVRDTHIFNSRTRIATWILNVAGPFSLWPRHLSYDRSRPNQRILTRIADQLSALLALPVNSGYLPDHSMSVQVYLTDEEWQRIFTAHYRNETRNGRRK